MSEKVRPPKGESKTLSPLVYKKYKRKFITNHLIELEQRERSSTVPTQGQSNVSIVFEENHIIGGNIFDLTLHAVRAGRGGEMLMDLIMGYRLYCTADEFFKILSRMVWDTNVDIDLKRKVVMAICLWVGSVPADFLSNNMLQDFIDEMKKLSIGWLNVLADKLDVALGRMNNKISLMEVDNIKDFLEFDLNDRIEIDCSDVEHVAEILTVLDSNLMNHLCFSDLYESNEKIGRNVLFTPLWVATQILKQPSKKKRTKYLAKFIQLCMVLRTRGNLNSLLSVYSGITLFSIQRLKKTWKALPEKANQQLAEIETLMSPRAGFQELRNYQAELAKAEHTIPCLMLYLKRISRAKESIEDFLEPEIINTSKLFALREISKDFEIFKSKHDTALSTAYFLHPDFHEISTTEELETLSFTLES